MKNAIEKYYKKLRENTIGYFSQDAEMHNKVSRDIASQFCDGYYPVERMEKTDLSLYSNEFGYELPNEIQEYINIYWHTYISGYCCSRECIVLFPVLKMEDDNCNDILYYHNGIIYLARQWMKIGDIRKHIPIGWLNYSGSFVLYEISSHKIYLEDIAANKDGVLEKEAIADNLVQLINNLKTGENA